jgi:hypothetical protein
MAVPGRSSAGRHRRLAMLRLIGTTIVVLLTTPPAFADEPPRFNIEATCKAAPALLSQDADPYVGCMRDERAAEASLIRQWASFRGDHRRNCVAETQVGGSPSYADVLTCVQMAADADGLPDAPARRAKAGQ